MSRNNSFRLLDLPHPFKAALAICSDIDGTSWDKFIAIHTFLNSTKATDFGEGLGLPISDSFWMYDNEKYENSAFSYYRSDKKTPSMYASQIRELIQAGVLDVMHSYGNFASKEEFNRKLAERALTELEKRNLRIGIWTNHGGIESSQNIGEKSAGFGDVPHGNADFYHSDLLLKYGIKFYWDCELSLTTVVGQDRKIGAFENWLISPIYFSFEEKIKATAKLALRNLPIPLVKKFLKNRAINLGAHAGNDLFEVDTLRDDQPISKFKRFGLGRYDWSDDLPNILNDRVFEKLLRERGKMIVYVHMGDRRDQRDGLPLSRPTIEKFKQIADLFHRKILWVTTTSQLLNFSLVRKYLNWAVEERENRYIIKILGLNKTIVPFDLDVSHLAGLYFSAPGDKEVILTFKERRLDIETFHSPEDNMQIIGIPIRTIEWPL